MITVVSKAVSFHFNNFNPRAYTHYEHGRTTVEACTLFQPLQHTCQLLQNVGPLGRKEVRDSILCEVRLAGLYSVMADECTDVAAIEQMSICI